MNHDERIEKFNSTGIKYDIDKGILPGDMYMACRNKDVVLLRCKDVHPDGFIIPEDTSAYCYDWHECVKVIE